MKRDRQSAFPVALQGKPVVTWTTADRALLLSPFLEANFWDVATTEDWLRKTGLLHGSLDRRIVAAYPEICGGARVAGLDSSRQVTAIKDLLSSQIILKAAREEALHAISLWSKTPTEARRVLTDVGRALRMVGTATVGFSEPIGSSLSLAIQSPDLRSQLALALLESLSETRTSGVCAYCKRWWTSPDTRQRKTCGASECDALRKAEWRKRNPEPSDKVNKRVRKHRKKQKAASRASGRKRDKSEES